MKPRIDQRVLPAEETNVTYFTTYQDASGTWYEGPDIYAANLEEAEAKLDILRGTIKVSGREA